MEDSSILSTDSISQSIKTQVTVYCQAYLCIRQGPKRYTKQYLTTPGLGT